MRLWICYELDLTDSPDPIQSYPLGTRQNIPSHSPHQVQKLKEITIRHNLRDQD